MSWADDFVAGYDFDGNCIHSAADLKDAVLEVLKKAASIAEASGGCDGACMEGFEIERKILDLGDLP